jgi:membrane protease YdiL (CAAX protease family)
MNILKLSGIDLRTFEKTDRKPGIVLITSTFLLVLHKYFGSIEFAREQLGVINESFGVFYLFFSAFVLLGLIPLLIIKLYFKESLSDYGFGFGRWRLGLRQVAILLPVIAIVMLIPASQTPEMRNFYPFDHSITAISYKFLRMEIWRILLFYTAWEFFFRGFMLFGLRKYFGDWMAICIQLIPQCLWHIGMPSGEIIASIPGGILFGLMAIQTRSIFWPLILHSAIGVILDFFIVLTV